MGSCSFQVKEACILTTYWAGQNHHDVRESLFSPHNDSCNSCGSQNSCSHDFNTIQQHLETSVSLRATLFHSSIFRTLPWGIDTLSRVYLCKWAFLFSQISCYNAMIVNCWIDNCFCAVESGMGLVVHIIDGAMAGWR